MWSQFIPGIYKYGDLKDIAGLIAPRPLLVESGIQDPAFPIDASKQAITDLEKVYQAAGKQEHLYKDLFEGNYEFSGRKAFAFFDKFL